MLQITIPATEQWDEELQNFISTPQQTLQLEHSLISIKKWEAKWHKSFISSKEPKTHEETIDYVKCMTITQNVNPDVYNNLTSDNIKAINEYIDAPMTATYFREEKRKPNREPVTAELIYYWMIALQIPVEFQKWHLNQLLTLINVCNIKNQPPKKRSRREIMSENAALNAARRKSLNTKG